MDMKCKFCNEKIICSTNCTHSGAICHNHEVDIKYFMSKNGYSFSKRDSFGRVQFVIENYITYNQCIIYLYSWDVKSDISRICLDFIPDWEPDSSLTEKISNLLLWL